MSNLLAISLYFSPSMSRALKISFAGEETAPWVQLLDAKGFVAKEYAVMAIPHLVLISPEGKIIGSFDKAEINRELLELFGN